ncbi:MAG TPA: phospholipase A, partial [Rhodanobacteraceae bacterium]|nr:phospholipase A [Rhodanobacteraceae bacterium]
CTAIETDSQRLACYDHATGRNRMAVAAKDAQTESAINVFSGGDRKSTTPSPAAPMSLLDSRWELAPESKLGTFNVRGYKPVYIMPLYFADRVNRAPHSPNPDNVVPAPQAFKRLEQKFQISFKTKVLEDIFGDNGALWLGYTQSSRWQTYNAELSRPFRETNYEPEAMLVFDTHYPVLGWDLRLLGIGVNHQSNGRGDPWSRSWNRLIANIGFERGDWVVMIRPWWRVIETAGNDDNPDITDYLGHGEVQVTREWNGHEFSLMLRQAINPGTDRGAARFSWSFPVAGNLRGYLELFNGYGESLIDYNHHASHFGLGVSLLDWY